MKYIFTDKEIKLLSALSLPFDPLSELNEDEELYLWDAISEKAGFGTKESDAYEEILVSIVKQDE
ncbi:MAG: hypothetical protein IJG63_01885 [Oscillospiraceae bacterium]|nr:hypothetical protein [Oscillospiraceae bacterium]